VSLLQRRVHAAALSAALLAGCSAPPPDLASAAQQLEARDREWSRLAAEGRDVDGVVSYWADDAVIVPQGQPLIEGKTAIRAYVAAAFHSPGFRISWKSAPPAFSPDGRLAYMRGANTLTLLGQDGRPVTVQGRALTIWRLEHDGQWRCVVDMWNDPPGTGAADAD
jgi:ketosteroid isomerase-like protein